MPGTPLVQRIRAVISFSVGLFKIGLGQIPEFGILGNLSFTLEGKRLSLRGKGFIGFSLNHEAAQTLQQTCCLRATFAEGKGLLPNGDG